MELPLGVAAESVDEDEGMFLWSPATGEPDVERGRGVASAVGDGEFSGRETAEAEEEGEVEVFEGDEAEMAIGGSGDEGEEVDGEAVEAEEEVARFSDLH